MDLNQKSDDKNECETLTPIQSEIVGELYTAFKRLGADEDLLALIGSWGDTLAENDVLNSLRNYNQSGTIWKKIVASR